MEFGNAEIAETSGRGSAEHVARKIAGAALVAVGHVAFGEDDFGPLSQRRRPWRRRLALPKCRRKKVVDVGGFGKVGGQGTRFLDALPPPARQGPALAEPGLV